MAKRIGQQQLFKDKIRGPDPVRPKNKSKRASYKKYRGQGRCR